MKERIYTIPINEALETDTECFMCMIEKKLEDDALAYYLGPAIMEPGTRISTNRTGFCREHYTKMLTRGNKLSLALTLQTHLDEVREGLKKRSKTAPAGLFSKKAAGLSAKSLCGYVDGLLGSCAVCERISLQMSQCCENFIWMWESELGFKNKVENTKGVCLKHFSMLLKSAEKNMPAKALSEFSDMLCRIELGAFERINDEVSWFTKKFDYQNTDAPWGSAKDSVERAAWKLTKY